MIWNVYCVYDTGISTWLKPIFAKNNGEILRSFIEACNSADSQFFKHSADYTLFEIGTFDDDKCKFDLLKSPVKLLQAIEAIRPSRGIGVVPDGRSEATVAL